MKKLIFLFISIIGLFISCDNEIDNSSGFTSQESDSNLVEKAAILFANSVIGSNLTRSNAQQVFTVCPVKSLWSDTAKGTRGLSNHTSLYTVSLKGNYGTVLVSSNGKRALPIAYFEDENVINDSILSDSTSDVTFLVENVIRKIKGGDSSFQIDSTFNPGNSDIDPNYNIIKRLEPKCKVHWSQRYPYNKYCFTSDGKQALAGCVAIAGGQALTVLQPQMSIVSSWNNIIQNPNSNTTKEEIAQLISYIGKQVGMNYGIEASGTKQSLTPLFASYGIKNYGDDNAINVLNTVHGIVVATGYRSRHGWLVNNYHDGHAFIADGYIENEFGNYYLHLNYGNGQELKRAYILTSKKAWREDEAKASGVNMYPYKLRFDSYTYENEKNW